MEDFKRIIDPSKALYSTVSLHKNMINTIIEIFSGRKAALFEIAGRDSYAQAKTALKTWKCDFFFPFIAGSGSDSWSIEAVLENLRRPRELAEEEFCIRSFRFRVISPPRRRGSRAGRFLAYHIFTVSAQFAYHATLIFEPAAFPLQSGQNPEQSSPVRVCLTVLAERSFSPGKCSGHPTHARRNER